MNLRQSLFGQPLGHRSHLSYPSYAFGFAPLRFPICVSSVPICGSGQPNPKSTLAYPKSTLPLPESTLDLGCEELIWVENRPVLPFIRGGLSSFHPIMTRVQRHSNRIPATAKRKINLKPSTFLRSCGGGVFAWINAIGSRLIFYRNGANKRVAASRSLMGKEQPLISARVTSWALRVFAAITFSICCAKALP